MKSDAGLTIERREFLKLTGAITALTLTPSALAGPSPRISIVLENSCADSIGRAAGQLRKALLDKGAMCEVVSSLDQAKQASFFVIVPDSSSSQSAPKSQTEVALSAESIRLTPET